MALIDAMISSNSTLIIINGLKSYQLIIRRLQQETGTLLLLIRGLFTFLEDMTDLIELMIFINTVLILVNGHFKKLIIPKLAQVPDIHTVL